MPFKIYLEAVLIKTGVILKVTNNLTFSASFLIKNSVTTFAASYRIFRSNFIFAVTLCNKFHIFSELNICLNKHTNIMY